MSSWPWFLTRAGQLTEVNPQKKWLDDWTLAEEKNWPIRCQWFCGSCCFFRSLSDFVLRCLEYLEFFLRVSPVDLKTQLEWIMRLCCEFWNCFGYEKCESLMLQAACIIVKLLHNCSPCACKRPPPKRSQKRTVTICNLQVPRQPEHPILEVEKRLLWPTLASYWWWPA